jgi:hypothetical protein
MPMIDLAVAAALPEATAGQVLAGPSLGGARLPHPLSQTIAHTALLSSGTRPLILRTTGRRHLIENGRARPQRLYRHQLRRALSGSITSINSTMWHCAPPN